MSHTTPSLVLVGAVLLFSCSSVPVEPTDDVAPQNRTLELVVSCGEHNLNVGALGDALLLFQLADEMRLHEIPNYEALPGMAETHCRLGNEALAQAILIDYLCMLDVEAGAKRCFLDGPSAPGSKNAELTEECFSRMCGEIYLGYYENPNATTLEAIERDRRRALSIQRSCQQSSEHKAEP
jgi:hypothetical protein